MKEEWRDVVGFPEYQVSNLGNVRSRKFGTWRSLKPGADVQDRLFVVLKKDNIRHNRRVHILVLEAFHGQRPDGYYGCHIDGDHRNNRATNLKWDTPRGNYDNAVKHGSFRGERNPAAKLTEEQVSLIRYESTLGVSYNKLARLFKVSKSNIHDIIKHHIWSHI